MKFRYRAALLAALVHLMAGPALAADSGVVTYSQGNCLIIKTNRGNTLFERSGGSQPAVKQRLTGVLHDFGYQTIYDGTGKTELLVGFVQNYGVKEPSSIEAFKKTCR